MIKLGQKYVRIKEGQKYARPDGSMVRISFINGGEVYYLDWRPGVDDVVSPSRMEFDMFKSFLREEDMRLVGSVWDAESW